MGNFWYDAFKADREEQTALPTITNAERVNNLRVAIEAYKRVMANAKTESERDWAYSAVMRREANLAKLL